MHLPVFQLINYILILIVLIFFIRLMWDVFFDNTYQPAEWKYALKQGKIPKILKKMEQHFPDKVRFFNWWFQVDRLRREKIPGDFAEVGVYQGESAKILHHLDSDRIFHLFDTFSGFPSKDLVGETGAAATYTSKNFADTSVHKVLDYIRGNDNIKVYPGYFPDTSNPIVDSRFALVNLDVDLYLPTKAALDFFYPRLSPGGVILIHDYNHQWQGVINAVNALMEKIPESLVLIPDQDGTVMIIRDK
ncbi:MAG: TylF/MycF family methyltransferase [Bacteroidales bacterium]|nr:TylF/MycF family methyltransferase [Bacteroidales bacterium]